MPGISFEDGRALDIRTAREVTPGFQEKDDFKRVAELSAISDEWIRSCPPRSDVGDIGDAYIPRTVPRDY